MRARFFLIVAIFLVGGFWLLGANLAGGFVPGDLDHDGFGDLVIGVPGEDDGDVIFAGAVHIMYGSADRLTANDDQMTFASHLGFEPDDDGFGSAIAVGFFNGDDFADVAISASSHENPTTGRLMGVVYVFYSNGFGLEDGDAFVHPDYDLEEEEFVYGSSLASGDFNLDGFDDLAVGTPNDDVNGVAQAGSVEVFYGSADGLTTSEMWHRAAGGVKGNLQLDARFGFAVTTGDFDGDQFDDLAIGVQGDTVEGKVRAGSVHILYGGPGGLHADRDQLWHEGLPDVEGAFRENDRFGNSLAAGDFDHDGRDDLAIGEVSVDNIGAVHVLFGGGGGLTEIDNQLWIQGDGGIPGVREFNDIFGSELASADFDNDGFFDLAIGVPGDDIGGKVDAGAVHVLFGSPTGLTSNRDKLFTQATDGIATGVDAGDNFGIALATGFFNGDNRADLVIGTNETIGGEASAGAIHVLYGSRNGPKASTSQFWHQNVGGMQSTSQFFDRFGSALGSGN